jgi:hypothetical protein
MKPSNAVRESKSFSPSGTILTAAAMMLGCERARNRPALETGRRVPLGRRSEGPRCSQPFGRPRDQPDRSTRRYPDSSYHSRSRYFCGRRLRGLPSARRSWRRPTAGSGRPSRGVASHQAASSAAERRTAETVRLSRLRLARFARSEHRRKSDGISRRKNFFIEGYFARLMYRSLYKMHEAALHGPMNVILDTIARTFRRRNAPVVKLH